MSKWQIKVREEASTPGIFNVFSEEMPFKLLRETLIFQLTRVRKRKHEKRARLHKTMYHFVFKDLF